MSVTRQPLATLVEDFSFYPRNHVDDHHVSQLVKAIKGGATLPPILADQKSLRIVDGFHRRRALLKVHGPEASGEVVLKRYGGDQQLFLAAVQANAHHGRRLDTHDQARVLFRARELGIADRVVAVTLCLPEPEIQRLAVRVVFDESKNTVPVKRGLTHLHGQTLTDGQLDAMDRVRSGEVGRLVMELSRLIEADLVNLEDPTVVTRLSELHRLLSRVLQVAA